MLEHLTFIRHIAMPLSIAFVVQLSALDALTDFVKTYEATLTRYQLLASQPLAVGIRRHTGVEVDTIADDPNNDDGLIKRISQGNLAAVIAFFEPETQSSDALDLPVDFFTLIRACQMHNVPLAINRATADSVMRSLKTRRVAHLIFNPVAGQGNADQDLALIRQVLEPNVQLHIMLTHPDVEIATQVKDVIATIQSHPSQTPSLNGANTDLVIASGGDGTVSAVAGALIETGIPLGIIPRGTANAFAVAMGIPPNLKEACETILAGNTRVVDAARCNDTPLILLAGIGFEAEAIANANREMKQFWGPLAYILSGVQQLNQQDCFDATIEIDHDTSQLSTVAITVANAAPQTSVLAQGFGQVIADDGLLDITIGTAKTRLQTINALASLFKSAMVRTPTEQDDILCLRSRYIRITTDPPRQIMIDGDMIGETPAEFECIPGGLTIYAPLSSV